MQKAGASGEVNDDERSPKLQATAVLIRSGTRAAVPQRRLHMTV